MEDGIETRLQLRQRSSTREAADNAEPAPSGIIECRLAVHHGRHPDVDELARFHAEEPFASYSHDAEIVAADLNMAAKHAGVSLKTPAPVVVADHHIRMSPRDAILGRSEDPTKGGRHTQDVEGVAGHELANGFFDRGIFVWNLDVRQVS